MHVHLFVCVCVHLLVCVCVCVLHYPLETESLSEARAGLVTIKLQERVPMTLLTQMNSGPHAYTSRALIL